jgi:aryl sulfotransferase
MKTAMPMKWPAKIREIHNHHMDSTKWNDFNFRDDDIVIATWAKSGTTWMQQIVSQLIFQGAEDIPVSQLSPWVDLRIMPPEAIAALESQEHRRFMKTHLPADAMVITPQVKYIYVARDGRDAVWSAYNHLSRFKPEVFDMFNKAPGRVGPELLPPGPSVHEFYRSWFAMDGYPLWSFWENIRSWWNIRHLPNVMLVHFNDLKSDLAGSIRDIARFLGIAIDEAAFQPIIRHCSFDYMKANAALVAPLGGAVWQGGGGDFINKGTNQRWRDTLTPADIRAYESRALIELGPDCAAWLEMGRGMRAAA